MARPNLILFAAIGFGAFILLSKKQPILADGTKPAAGDGSTPDDDQEPQVDAGGSDTGDDGAAKPSGDSGSGGSATNKFTLGSDPFPAFSMALTAQSRGTVWYTKHPTSGRWGESTKDFGSTEGYKNIGALARNHTVIEVQTSKGGSLWKPSVWNAYGYPVSFPLQAF